MEGSRLGGAADAMRDGEVDNDGSVEDVEGHEEERRE